MLVSIVITTYNRPLEVTKAIESAIKQSYNDIEVIVIQDGPETPLKNWISENYPNVRYFSTGINKGLSSARNIGVDVSKGDFLAFLDDDDIWDEMMIECKVNFFKEQKGFYHKAIGLIMSGFSNYSESNRLVKTTLTNLNDEMKVLTLEKGVIQTVSSSLFIVRDFFEKGGRFDEKLLSSIDHDIWMQLVEMDYVVVTVPKILVSSYDKGNRVTMMTDSTRRLQGMNQFIEKWSPFLLENMGTDRWQAFNNSYRRRVICMYSKSKIEERNFTGWYNSYLFLLANSSSKLFDTYFFAKRTTLDIINQIILRFKGVK